VGGVDEVCRIHNKPLWVAWKKYAECTIKPALWVAW